MNAFSTMLRTLAVAAVGVLLGADAANVGPPRLPQGFGDESLSFCVYRADDPTQTAVTVVPVGTQLGMTATVSNVEDDDGETVTIEISTGGVSLASGSTDSLTAGDTPSTAEYITYTATATVTKGDDSTNLGPVDVTVAVVAVDLSMQGLGEETEGTPHDTDPGAFIGLNADDDDDDGTIDSEQNGTVEDENNLVPVALGFTPGDLDSGTLTLSAAMAEGGGVIKVWTDATKGTEIELPATWNLRTDSVPETVYVEGTSGSAELKDVELTWTYDNGDVTTDDAIAMTVFFINETASGDYIVPGSQRNRVEFTIGPDGVAGESGTLEVRPGGSSSADRTIGLEDDDLEAGNHSLDWNGKDDGGSALIQASSPYTYVLSLAVNEGLAESVKTDRKVEEWGLAVIIGDRPAGTDLVTGVDEDTITTERFVVQVRFENEGEAFETIPNYEVDANQACAEGPADNE